MKRLLLLLPALLALTTPRLGAQSSSGNYRIPYADSLATTVLVDHVSHTLSNRVDLRCIDTSVSQTSYFVVAADAGVVRAIRDTGTGGCGTCTNYVWIEHANGEWTGYFYLRANSVPNTLGIGTNVTAGQVIAVEGQIGSPGGFRLRFEVGVPANPNDPIVTTTGMIKGSSRVPIICNVTDNVFKPNTAYNPVPCFGAEISRGIYRMPYANNVTFKVNNDHLTHNPKTRYDLGGKGGVGADPTYPIVAAAAGQVMWIVDSNNITCSSCSASNNYLWIRHNNGEWTKYTHFMTGSVTTNAGLRRGTNVVAGQYLGDEGKIGAASGDHLHFEVAVPDNGHLYTNAFQPNITNAFQVAGGFINGINRIPLFCDVSGGIIYDGDEFIASNCSGGGCVEDIVVPGATIRSTRAYIASDTVDTANNGILVDTYGSLALYAGNKVTLRPGFRAAGNSYMRAAIQPCFNPP